MPLCWIRYRRRQWRRAFSAGHRETTEALRFDAGLGTGGLSGGGVVHPVVATTIVGRETGNVNEARTDTPLDDVNGRPDIRLPESTSDYDSMT